jgi:predicted RNase H-like HicB family nuclease
MTKKIKIIVSYDEESKVYFGSSPMVKGLNIEANSLDEIRKEFEITLPELLELNEGMKRGPTNFGVKIAAELKYNFFI